MERGGRPTNRPANRPRQPGLKTGAGKKDGWMGLHGSEAHWLVDYDSNIPRGCVSFSARASRQTTSNYAPRAIPARN